MIFNNDKLNYPDNIYADAAKFHAENEARCYYYHSVSTDRPENARETVDYLIDSFFSKREKLTGLIELVYRQQGGLEPAAEKLGISKEEAEETLKQFYRDLLYFPRYNDIFTKGK